jgi:hypothetical protein
MERSPSSPMRFCKSGRNDLIADQRRRSYAGPSGTAISIFIITTADLAKKIGALIQQKIASQRPSLHLSGCEEFAILSVQY